MSFVLQLFGPKPEYQTDWSFDTLMELHNQTDHWGEHECIFTNSMTIYPNAVRRFTRNRKCEPSSAWGKVIRVYDLWQRMSARICANRSSKCWDILQVKLNFHLLVGLEERSGNHPSYYDSCSGDQKSLNKIVAPLVVAEILHNITIRWGLELAFLELFKTGHWLINCLHKFLLKIVCTLLLLQLPYVANVWFPRQRYF